MVRKIHGNADNNDDNDDDNDDNNNNNNDNEDFPSEIDEIQGRASFARKNVFA